MANWVLGLTGGIGSGKSVASHFFSQQNIDVIDADVCAREVVNPGTPALNSIAERYGESILSSGMLNRPALRKIIFKTSSERDWLENLLHPIIWKNIQEQIKTSNTYYTVLASPLLLEKNQNTLCKRILLIDATEENQISRTKKRDQCTEEDVRNIIATQWSREMKKIYADDIINNNGNINDTLSQLKKLHNHYLSL